MVLSEAQLTIRSDLGSKPEPLAHHHARVLCVCVCFGPNDQLICIIISEAVNEALALPKKKKNNNNKIKNEVLVTGLVTWFQEFDLEILLKRFCAILVTGPGLGLVGSMPVDD